MVGNWSPRWLEQGNIAPIFRKGRKEDPGNLSASPLCLGRAWSRSFTPRPSTACPCLSLQAAISTSQSHWRKMPFLPCLLGNLTSLAFPGFSHLWVLALIAARLFGISSHSEGLWIHVSYFHARQWFQCFNSITNLTLLEVGEWWDGWLMHSVSAMGYVHFVSESGILCHGGSEESLLPTSLWGIHNEGEDRYPVSPQLSLVWGLTKERKLAAAEENTTALTRENV